MSENVKKAIRMMFEEQDHNGGAAMSRKRLLPGVLFLVLFVISGCGSGAGPAATATDKLAPGPSPKPLPTSAPSRAASPSPTSAPVSFAGKTVTVVVAVVPGGGTDIVARVYAKYFPKHLPGNPTVIVRNIPGGADAIGTNFVYSSRPDGLTILCAPGTTPLNQLVGVGAVRYDLRKMTAVIGTGNGSLLYIRPGIIDKPEDLPRARGLVYGHAPAILSYQFCTVREFLDFPVEKVVLGYSGSADSGRAFLTGEINTCVGTSPTYVSDLKPLVEAREAKLLFQSGVLDQQGNIVRHPGCPADVITLKELYERIYGKSPSGMAFEAYRALLAASEGMKMMLLVLPGTPDSIIRAYWDGLNTMSKDAEFLKRMVPLIGGSSKLSTGEDNAKAFKLNFRMDPKVQDWLKGTLRKYGVVVD